MNKSVNQLCIELLWKYSHGASPMCVFDSMPSITLKLPFIRCCSHNYIFMYFRVLFNKGSAQRPLELLFRAGSMLNLRPFPPNDLPCTIVHLLSARGNTTRLVVHKANCSLELEHTAVFCSCTIPKWIVEPRLTLNHTEGLTIGGACANGSVRLSKCLTRSVCVQNASQVPQPFC